MKTNKVLKWLYGVFMFLPMLAIGVTCAYVTFNKNAKDSYSNQLVQNVFNDSEFTITLSEEITKSISFINLTNTITYDSVDFTNTSIVYDNKNYTLSSQNTSRILYAYNSYYIVYSVNNWNNQANNKFFDFYNNVVNLPNDTIVWHLTQLTYDAIKLSVLSDINSLNTNTLDNAFYYAVDQFNESGFNKIDFVSFFDMFYENTNIWTTFANTYMNYVLFVSLAFFIPRVLYWFINLAFSFTDSFERKSQRW